MVRGGQAECPQVPKQGRRWLGWTLHAPAPLLVIPILIYLQQKDAASSSMTSCWGCVPCVMSQPATRACATPWGKEAGRRHRGAGALVAPGACVGGLSPGDSVCHTHVPGSQACPSARGGCEQVWQGLGTPLRTGTPEEGLVVSYGAWHRAWLPGTHSCTLGVPPWCSVCPLITALGTPLLPP